MPLLATATVSVKLWPGKTTYNRSAPTVCESEPNDVELVVMPAMIAVPGFAEARRMVPAAGRLPPSVACTWMPLMVKVSPLLVALTHKVTVIVDDATETEALVILLPATNDT